MAKGMQDKAGAKWGIRMSTTPDQELQNSLAFPWSNGGQIVSADGAKWTLNDPAVVEGVKFYQSLFTEKIADPAPDSGAGAAESAFVGGDLGILGRWARRVDRTRRGRRPPASRTSTPWPPFPVQKRRHLLRRRFRPGRVQGQ